MIFDALERAYTVANTNFATDMAAIVTAKGLSGLTTTATFVKRQRAETFRDLGAPLPACGVYWAGLVTQAKNQQKRDGVVSLVYDYYAEGDETEVVEVSKQVELAVTALLLSVDRMAGGADLVFGGGEGDGSITVEPSDGFSPPAEPKGVKRFWARAMILFPVNDWDNV